MRTSNAAAHMRVSTRIAFLAIVALTLAGLGACRKQPAPALYYCPMHPAYTSDRPGSCPICGMQLVAAAPGTRPSSTATAPERPADAAGQASPAEEIWACPMHPEVRQHGPGKCPKCGMDLVKQAAAPAAPPADAGAPGLAPVHADAQQVQLAGVRTAAAAKDTLVGSIRTVGTVVPDETGIRQVNTKVAGWVQKLFVNATGRAVRAGQPLFELYSPELLASQEEYVRARQAAAQFESSSLPEVRRGGQDLAAAARRRLELFDVPPEFLARLEQSGQPQRTIIFRAPFSGFVTEKNVVEGQRVEPGMSLLTLTDLSRVWVDAQLYEADARAAQPGLAATVTLPYDPGVTLRGRVTLVYPTMQAESRTIRVRLEFANPRLALKPGMFVNVELAAQRASGIVVPDSALIDTGTRQVVFVEVSPGHFQPRDVQAGLRADGRVIVRSGLREGELVATAANFLLDSESRLRAALNAAAPAGTGQPAAKPEHVH